MRQRSYKQIEDSRNRRLWITSVIMPAIVAGSALYSGNPQVKGAVDDKIFKLSEAYKLKKTEIKDRYDQWKVKRES